MRGGGWVATHTDVTEQLLAEKERDSLRQREQRRRAVDVAISSFRARVENVLETVSQSGAAMKAAARSLLTLSRPHLATHRRRGAWLERSVGQCRNRSDGRGGTFRLD
jgi:hypothetical protein